MCLILIITSPATEILVCQDLQYASTFYAKPDVLLSRGSRYPVLCRCYPGACLETRPEKTRVKIILYIETYVNHIDNNEHW